LYSLCVPWKYATRRGCLVRAVLKRKKGLGRLGEECVEPSGVGSNGKSVAGTMRHVICAQVLGAIVLTSLGKGSYDYLMLPPPACEIDADSRHPNHLSTNPVTAPKPNANLPTFKLSALKSTSCFFHNNIVCQAGGGMGRHLSRTNFE
jgi:hypothetical protein